MSEEGLPPLGGPRKAMRQISGAIVGVTVVLISVFVPLAFFRCHRQYLPPVFEP